MIYNLGSVNPITMLAEVIDCNWMCSQICS